MTLKIKDKKIILTKLLFRQLYITRKFESNRIRYFPEPDPDPGDPKSPDPDPQH